jgi:ssDNA-specific exonuclease RecJ
VGGERRRRGWQTYLPAIGDGRKSPANRTIVFLVNHFAFRHQAKVILDNPNSDRHNLTQFAIKQSFDNLFLYFKNPKNRFLGTVIVLIVF